MTPYILNTIPLKNQDNTLSGTAENVAITLDGKTIFVAAGEIGIKVFDVQNK